jgi:hypothetical protein
MTEHDPLTAAVDAAAERYGYAWVVGTLEGAIRSGWTPEQTTAFLENS